MKGFTLIELLIVIVIVAVLAVIALPLYRTYILKSNRTDALATLLQIENAQENYRISQSQYATLTQLGISSTTPKGYYTIAINFPTTTGYTITATANGNQINDTNCTTISIVVSNGVETKSPTTCWQ